MKNFKSLLALMLSVLTVFSVCTAAFADSSTSEVEPNGGLETATLFTTTATGNIEDSGDEDYFKFEMASAKTVQVALEHAATDSHVTHFVLVVLNADGEEEARVTSKGSDATVVTNNFCADKGIHYVKVTSGQAANPSLIYRVNVIINSNAACEVEPNNTASNATTIPLTSGSTKCLIYGYAAKGDIDYYKLVSPAPGYMQLDIINDNGVHGDYDVKIVQILGANILEESVLCSFTVSTGGDTIESSTTVNLDTGNYYVIVSPMGSTYGGYAVDVFYRTEAKRETEFNNNKYSADLIPMNNGEKMTATLSAPNDVDMFKVVTSKTAGSCALTFAAHESVLTYGSWQVTVYQDDATTVVENGSFTFSKGNPASYSFAELDYGTYYIKVTKGSSYESGRYIITLKSAQQVKKSSFLDFFKTFDWSGLWASLKTNWGWLFQVNTLNMLWQMLQSIINIFKNIL
ncbi:MAG: hypothetical protein K6B52_04420 [Clostridiales bacterium]|nr:hypothetical protein [Clostridiales bacterium]